MRDSNAVVRGIRTNFALKGTKNKLKLYPNILYEELLHK